MVRSVLSSPIPVRVVLLFSLVHNSAGKTDAECSDYFGLGSGNCAVGRPSYLSTDLINLFGRLGPGPAHVMLRRCAEVQGIDQSSAGLNATKDEHCWLRCRGSRMHEDRRICGAGFGYSLAGRQEVEDGVGRPPQLAASFICPYRSPGHHVDGGSLAVILPTRSATRWLRLYG